MSAFNEVRRCSWDTETTGTDPEEARVVTAAILFRGGSRPDQSFSYLIDPGIEIPAEASGIHGVTTEKAQAEGQDPKVALDDIATKLAAAITWGMPVVAFNQSYDWTVLHHDLARNDLPSMGERLDGRDPVTLIDPHVIDRQMDRSRKGSGMRKLKPTAEVYGVELADWHTAEADALAALLIAEAQFDRYPQLQEFGPAGLYALQQKWRAHQQSSLQEWFRTKATVEQGGDPDKVINGEWPLQTRGEAS